MLVASDWKTTLVPSPLMSGLADAASPPLLALAAAFEILAMLLSASFTMKISPLFVVARPLGRMSVANERNTTKLPSPLIAGVTELPLAPAVEPETRLLFETLVMVPVALVHT